MIKTGLIVNVYKFSVSGSPNDRGIASGNLIEIVHENHKCRGSIENYSFEGQTEALQHAEFEPSAGISVVKAVGDSRESR